MSELEPASSMFDPDILTNKLPNRPLKPDEVHGLCDEFNWSVQKVVYETEANNVECVPVWYAFRYHEPHEPIDSDPVGDALGFFLDDDTDTWEAEVLETDTTESTWLKAGELYGKEMGIEFTPEQIVIGSGDDKTVRELVEE
jgi:hypothetical protein